MVAVPVREQDEVAPFRGALVLRALGVAGEEGVDVDARPGLGVEPEGRVAEPGESGSHAVEPTPGAARCRTGTAARGAPLMGDGAKHDGHRSFGYVAKRSRRASRGGKR